MSVFESIFNFAVSTIDQLGYGGIFVLMALESMIFPIPSEAVMPFAGFLMDPEQGKFTVWGVALASSSGSLLGSWLSYWMGYYGGRPFLARFGKYFLLDQHHLELTERFFAEHGEKAVFISRFIPIVRHLVSIPAGTAKMGAIPFTLYTLLGASMWNMFLAWLGLLLKENWRVIKTYTHYLDYVVLLCLILLFVWGVRHLLLERKAGKITL